MHCRWNKRLICTKTSLFEVWRNLGYNSVATKSGNLIIFKLGARVIAGGCSTFNFEFEKFQAYLINICVDIKLQITKQSKVSKKYKRAPFM